MQPNGVGGGRRVDDSTVDDPAGHGSVLQIHPRRGVHAGVELTTERWMSRPRLRFGDPKDVAELKVPPIAALYGEHHVQLGTVVKRLRVPGRIDRDTGPPAATRGPTSEARRSGPSDHAHTGASPGDVSVLTGVAARLADGPRIGDPSGYGDHQQASQRHGQQPTDKTPHRGS